VEVVPISSVSGENLEVLERRIASHLPISEFLFPPDQVTTASQRFLAAELIREKLTRVLHEELPYALTVEIETFAESERMIRIGAVIWVERASQKGIVIGKGGTVLKDVGRQSREDMENLFQRKVYLETWVRVRKGWPDDERALHSFGYRDEV
jgi:GTP-binding protein Era